MTNEKYGTPQFYAELFADVLADVGTGLRQRDEETAKAIMAGFELAIMDWPSHHENCIKSYRDLHALFLGIADYKDPFAKTDE